MYTGFGVPVLGFGVRPQGQGLRLWGLGGLRRLRLLCCCFYQLLLTLSLRRQDLVVVGVLGVLVSESPPCKCTKREISKGTPHPSWAANLPQWISLSLYCLKAEVVCNHAGKDEDSVKQRIGCTNLPLPATCAPTKEHHLGKLPHTIGNYTEQ